MAAAAPFTSISDGDAEPRPRLRHADGHHRAGKDEIPGNAHVLRLDPDTGVVEVVDWTAVDDVGRAINPMTLDGQTHGGIVQGAGEALGELCAIDEHGQPLAGSFMDYHMPRADEYPSFVTALNEVPSPTNPLGIKAGGEGGTTPALAVLVNGFVDALRPYGVRDIRMPVTPRKIWELIHAGEFG